ncbi:MAG: hypothetical protein GX207_03435 [Peptococcaceae bacterium]|nr:hypothetical protein [Peptococcaceae bacterium]
MSQDVNYLCDKEEDVDELAFAFSVVESLLSGIEPIDREVAYLFFQNNVVLDKINAFLDGMEKAERVGLDAYSAFLGIVAGTQLLLWSQKSDEVIMEFRKMFSSSKEADSHGQTIGECPDVQVPSSHAADLLQ